MVIASGCRNGTQLIFYNDDQPRDYRKAKIIDFSWQYVLNSQTTKEQRNPQRNIQRNPHTRSTPSLS